MFEMVSTAPEDPILGLTDLFNADNRCYKINLSIGIYKDSFGNTPILNSVKKAEQYLLEHETTKNYLSIEGSHLFAYYNKILLFGNNSALIDDKRIITIQTPGGTGALRIAADFLVSQTICKRVWISNPSWPNHYNIFHRAGLKVLNYRYYDSKNHNLDFDGMLDSLNNVEVGDAVLFHGCCHNPTGIDPTNEQWQQLSKFTKLKKIIPLFDLAYQGFARNLNADAQGIRIFALENCEVIITNSYSKNFGLYNDRIGALTVITQHNQQANNILSQLKYIIRTNYSNPPAHGASIVIKILSDNQLYDNWKKELNSMRNRIQNMRKLFVNNLQNLCDNDFNFINHQYGMFSFSGLNKEQVMSLRKSFGIYIVDSGRINIAGITPTNISQLCQGISKVLLF